MKELQEYYVFKVGAKPLGLLVLLGNVDCCCCCANPLPSNPVLPPFVIDYRKTPQSEVADYLPLDDSARTLMTLPHSILISKWRCFRSSDEVKAIHSPAQWGSSLPSLCIDTREIIISATSLALDYASVTASCEGISTLDTSTDTERGLMGEDRSKPMIPLKWS